MPRPRILFFFLLLTALAGAVVWRFTTPTGPPAAAAASEPDAAPATAGNAAMEADDVAGPLSANAYAPTAEDYELDAPRRRNELGQPLPFREATLDPGTARLLRNSRRGNVVSLQLFPDRHLTARITGHWDDDDGLRVAARFDGGTENDRLFMSWHPDEVRGLIQLASENTAYEITTEDGTYVVREWLLTDVICATPAPGGRSASTGLPRPAAAPQSGMATNAAQLTSIEVPALRSKPGETDRVIYLDFDGETVSGTWWADGATIVAPPARLNPSEIREVWERVSRDFEPFRVNITTVRADLDNARIESRIHVIITENDTASPGAGGVALIDVFNSSNPGYKIAWAFVDDNARSCGKIITHEVGHTLGLLHDGRLASGNSPREEYYEGHGIGETGWAPIMGIGFYRELVQWSKGEYARANNPEDDLAIISDPTQIPYDTDDHGTSLNSATAITGDRAAGVIGRNTDVDYFRISLPAGAHTIFLNRSAFAPIDLELQVLNAQGQSLGIFNPPELRSATANFSLSAAQDIYLRVTGVGQGDPLGTGYTDYASLGSYTLEGFGTQNQPPSAPIGLSTTRVSGSQIRVSWTVNPAATSYVVTRDGTIIATLFGNEFLDTAAEPSTTYSYTVTASNQHGSSLPSPPTEVTSPAFDEFIMDGEPDFDGYLISDPGMRIYAAVRGSKLYVATWSPGDNNNGGSDHLLMISDTLLPSATTPAPWTKSGFMAIPGDQPFLAGESTNTFAGWFNTRGPTTLFKSRVNSGMLEGVIDLVAEFGQMPENIYLAAVAYGTQDNGGINGQAPAGNGNNNLEPAEFLRVPVRALADGRMNGTYDVLDAARAFRADLVAGSTAAMVLRWPVVPGHNYQPQGSTSLAEGSWQNLTPQPWTAAPAQWEMEFTDTAAPVPAKFYRIIRP